MAIPPRRRARCAVLQALYAYALSGDSPSHVNKTVLLPRLPPQEGAMDLGIALFSKVLEEHDALDEIIATNAKNWDLKRILRIDLNHSPHGDLRIPVFQTDPSQGDHERSYRARQNVQYRGKQGFCEWRT